MPGGAYSKRFTLFDGAGNGYFDSEWVSDSQSTTISKNTASTCAFSGGSFSTLKPSAAPGEFRHCFDPFGRAQEVVGTSHSSLTTVNRNDGDSFYSDTLEAESPSLRLTVVRLE